MGTHALTRVYDEHGNLVLYLYSQSGGYPQGLGAEYREKLGHLRLVNGLGDDRKVANGMACFAAQLIAAVKTDPGGFYIQAPSDDVDWAEFIYDFRPNKPGYAGQKEERHLVLTVQARYLTDHPVLYEGPFAEFDPKKAEEVLEEAVRKIDLDY